MRNAIQNFADTTSMHGVPRVINAKTLLSRVFWTLVCLGAVIMFLTQVTYILMRYYSYPKKVTIEVSPSKVPFPSISVCNMRNLDVYILHKLNRMFLENDDPHHHIGKSTNRFINSYMSLVSKFGPLFYKYQLEYPEIFQEIFSRTTFSANIPKEIIAEAGVQLSGFLVTCMYAGKECQTKQFLRFFDPYYYNCFTYTAPKLSSSTGFDGSESLVEGIENGWSSIFMVGSGMLDRNKEVRMLPGLSEWKSPVSASEGIRVVIHPPGTIPYPFTEGYDIPPGFSASLGIKPRKNIRVGLPHGNCSKADPFGSQSGSCFGSGSVYRLMSCQKMCLQKEIMTACNCADVSLPLLPNTDPVLCTKNDKLSDSCMTTVSPKCLQDMLDQYKRIKCMQDTRRRIMEEGGIASKCDCFPPCEDVTYDVSYSLSKWPASSYEGDTSFNGIFSIIKYKERFYKPETMGKYELFAEYFNISEPDGLKREESLKNFARLNVYIADGNVVKTEESPDYTGSDVISDIGGQLGLWVGISVITLAEVFALVADILTYLLAVCRSRGRHNFLRTNRNSDENKSDGNNFLREKQLHYSKIKTNTNVMNAETILPINSSNQRNRQNTVTAYLPNHKSHDISVTGNDKTTNQWTRKFVDHNSRKSSIPMDINGYSEV